MRVGAQVFERTGSPSLPLRRQSSPVDLLAMEGSSFAAPGSRNGGMSSALPLASSLEPALSRESTAHRLPYHGFDAARIYHATSSSQAQSLKTTSDRPPVALHGGSCGIDGGCEAFILVNVASICKHDRLRYWDLHVHGVENYLSSGIVNHNSGKSHFFAERLIEDSLSEPGDYSGEGLRSVCIREVQKDLAQSSKMLIEGKLASLKLTERDGFKVYKTEISTPGDGLIIFKGMQDYTADSIKSLENFKRSWWEEAQSATAHSLNLLRPTLRAVGSQRWFSWNPRRRADPIDRLLRGPALPTGSVVVRANWADNPWFTSELEQERQDCLNQQPEQYDHIWEGGYATILEGAYYAKDLALARLQGRIGRVVADREIEAFAIE